LEPTACGFHNCRFNIAKRMHDADALCHQPSIFNCGRECHSVGLLILYCTVGLRKPIRAMHVV
jgi:hypothetical protein